MRIGFDISQTGSESRAGCGYYAQSLFHALVTNDKNNENAVVALPSFGDFYFDQQFQLQCDQQFDKRFEFGPTHQSIAEAREFWNSSDFEAALDLDIIHSNNFWCPNNLASTRLIYSLYDLGFVLNPESWTTEINRLGCFDGVFKASLEADWIVAISEASKNHFLEVFPYFPEDRIKVIYPCSRFIDIKSAPPQPDRFKNLQPQSYWLSVGTIEPRKNQSFLLSAYKAYLDLGGLPIPLVLVGGYGWMMDDFEKKIQENGLVGQVIFAGYTSDEELKWLYGNCVANLYPSLYEGFGLPILEGMQFGAPTICSNTSSMPEVAGSAGLLLDPIDSRGWSEAMYLLSQDLDRRNNMRDAGYKECEKFNWNKSARQLYDLYGLALSLPKRKAPKDSHL